MCFFNIDQFTCRYLSFKNSRNSDESNEKITKSYSTNKDNNARSFAINEAVNKCKCNPYYNTISDPVNPWFKDNGLPASKSLHDDRIAFYCQDFGKIQQVANAGIHLVFCVCDCNYVRSSVNKEGPKSIFFFYICT